jgi:hypothetical protein
MRAESGKNGLEPVAIILPRITRSARRRGVFAALIGRHGEHIVAFAELWPGFPYQQIFNCCGDRSVSALPTAQ